MPNALASIYSFGDSLKRKIGALKNPLETAALGATRFGEDQDKLLSLMADAGYLPGQNSVLQTPQGKAQAGQELADKSMESLGGLLGATVWHGSPHKFDAFDASKIGTGEGAQAYGHGLYLADAPDVAKNYLHAGEFQFNSPHRLASDTVSKYGDETKAMKHLRDLLPSKDSTDTLSVQRKKLVESAIDSLGSGSYKSITPNLYKVDLPDEHIAKMLDWDKPLSQQAPEVQKALMSHPDIQDIAGFREGAQWADEALGPWQVKDSLTGGDLVKELEAYFAGRGKGITRAAGPSSQLRDAGIPGIRYLDGGSRGAGTGTSNFVIFPGNEKLLRILERNGQAIP